MKLEIGQKIYALNTVRPFIVKGKEYEIIDLSRNETFVIMAELKAEVKYLLSHLNNHFSLEPLEKTIKQYNIEGGIDEIAEPKLNIINPTKIQDLTNDKIVLSVMNDLNERSKVGLNKYGVTLERNDLSLKEWLIHFREELMDAILYIKRIESELNEENRDI